MTHRRAVVVMLAVTLMWSIAGVVTRQLDAARGFEVTFWRSAFTALALLPMLIALRGPAGLARALRRGGRTLWISGLCWSVMFTAFMVALTLTSVANVLVTMSLAPLLTALVARLALGHRLPPRTWGAIVVAGCGIGWMYANEMRAGGVVLLGTLVALCVPVAAAINWTTIQSLRAGPAAELSPGRSEDSCAPPRGADAVLRGRGPTYEPADLLPAVLLGALLSALVALPLAQPLAASAHDLVLLALLGVVQLAIPCLLSVAAARVLSAPEVALLALLEVVFGVLWAWLGAGEAPSPAVLGGGGLVLAALVANEALALRHRP